MTSIRKAPISVQNVITYDAVIGVSNPELKLFPGMTASVNAALRHHPVSATAATGGGRGAALQKAVWILDAKGNPQRIAATHRTPAA